jgi:D-sedoheptulose 7-phosphate isomerase
VDEAINNHLNILFERYQNLRICEEDIMAAYRQFDACFSRDGKILVCGNGGSAADAEHIVGELMKGFLLRRKLNEQDKGIIRRSFPKEAGYLTDHLQGALPAISLVSQSALSSAFINDVAADMVYAQQVYGYGQQGDLLIAISTSGNSMNVVNAVKIAKSFGLLTLGLTGEDGGMLRELCDVIVSLPSKETYRIQEYLLPVYHALCAMIEAKYFATDK